jgi:hypothetical protein
MAESPQNPPAPPSGTGGEPTEAPAPAPAPRRRASQASGSGELWGGKFEITGEVGSGAMGRVLRGFDTKLRREVALKVTKLPRQEMPRDELARFVEEAQVTAQLEHPNVAPVHDLGLGPDGHGYFSMKLVRGRSLATILEERRAGDPATLAQFGLRRLLDVFQQVCQAIEYAHARGVVHRDLKPANIMVGDFGEVLVMDFGVAKLVGSQAGGVTTKVDETEASEGGEAPSPPTADVTSVRTITKAWETHAGTIVGTPEYMAPEQAKGLTVDGRADLYALGVILYEILCGRVPFENDDPQRTLVQCVSETPDQPSRIRPGTPAALEALTLRLLVKDPEDRTLGLQQVREHIQNYTDGVARRYEREPLWTGAAWGGGALLTFAFLVWYLTGQSIATVLALGPPAVLNAIGWFLLVLSLGYPLWAGFTAFRLSREEPDPFRAPRPDELFVSGFLSHRTFSAALAPLFQLVFIVELVVLASLQVRRGALASTEAVRRMSLEMRAQWSEALIVVLVFQFAYLFLLTAEVRFARRIDRHELLLARPRWESVWPFFLLVVLLSTVITTQVLDFALGTPTGNLQSWLKEELLTPSLDLVDVGKTLVFQGTFLLALSGLTMVAAYSFREILAALRAPAQAADAASVTGRAQYFLRSVATFRTARAVWLYGGAMIGSLTAIRLLSEAERRPLLVTMLYILVPSVLGFIGYSLLRRATQRYIAQEPALRRMLEERQEKAREAQRQANLLELERSPRHYAWLGLALPILCAAGYVAWLGGGLAQARSAVVSVSTKDWLLSLPYVLLFAVLPARDIAQRWFLRRRGAERRRPGAVPGGDSDPLS